MNHTGVVSDPGMMRDRLIAELDARGVDDAAMVALGVGDHALPGALAACQWWDEQRAEHGEDAVGIGMLVQRVNGCLSEHEVNAQRGGALGSVEARVRAVALTPDGISRELVVSIFAPLARRMGIKPVRLVESAMGRAWRETPPHPCKLPGDPLAPARYQALLAGDPDDQVPPDYTLTRRPVESDVEWSMRFWRWRDGADVQAAAAALEEALARRAEDLLAAYGDDAEQRPQSAAAVAVGAAVGADEEEWLP